MQQVAKLVKAASEMNKRESSKSQNSKYNADWKLQSVNNCYCA